MKLTETGWEIEGSSGGSVRLGTPLARVEMGRGNIVLPIRHTHSGQTVRLTGVGVGLGASLSISPPVNVTWSPESFPSAGIGKIYAGYARPHADLYQSQDFQGGLLVSTIGAGKQISSSISCVTWLSDPVDICMARLNCSREELVQIARNTGLMILKGGLIPIGRSHYIRERFMSNVKALGLLSGSSLETQLVIGHEC